MTSQKNNSGVSLVELMIAAAIISVLAVAFSAYMSNVTRQQKHVQENMDITQVNATVNAAANDALSIYQSAQQGITTTTGSGLPNGENIDYSNPADTTGVTSGVGGAHGNGTYQQPINTN